MLSFLTQSASERATTWEAAEALIHSVSVEVMVIDTAKVCFFRIDGMSKLMADAVFERTGGRGFESGCVLVAHLIAGGIRFLFDVVVESMTITLDLKEVASFSRLKRILSANLWLIEAQFY